MRRTLAHVVLALSALALGACNVDPRDNYVGTYTTATNLQATQPGGSPANAAVAPNLQVSSLPGANQMQLAFDSPSCTLIGVVSGNTFTVNPGSCTDSSTFLFTTTPGATCTVSETLSGSGSRSPGNISVTLSDPNASWTCSDSTTGSVSVSWAVTGNLQ